MGRDTRVSADEPNGQKLIDFFVDGDMYFLELPHRAIDGLGRPELLGPSQIGANGPCGVDLALRLAT